MKNDMPQRKQIRLKNYNYSQQGYYFVTICTKDRKNILSKIINNETILTNNVGVDAHIDPKIEDIKIKLSKLGKIVEKYINNYNNNFKNIKIHNYIIMPDHVHLIIELRERFDVGIDPYNSQYNKIIKNNLYKRIWLFNLATKL